MSSSNVDTFERQASVTNKYAEQQITLVDHTASVTPNPEQRDSQDGGLLSLNPTLSEQALTRRWTSLQQQYTQRKYARYDTERNASPSGDELNAEGGSLKGKDGRYQRSKMMVKALLKKAKQKRVQEEDAVIDILYENQRGSFFFGLPLFSSKSLLNFDPKPWVNANKKASPVNITNAQVPDPDWEWAWKSWYVDMSRDVDEEGWEYSFSFQNGFNWHGNHPWFHSFVRRRRWLRKRIRKHAHHGDGRDASKKHVSEAHMLTAEYFTIHASRTRSVNSSKAPSSAASGGGRLHQHDEYDKEEQSEVRDIASLFVYLRKASIDREKLVLVRKFVANATDDLYYLAEQMHHIMALFVFQNSRRRLLAILMEQFNEASEHRKRHEDRDEAEGAKEKERIDNLLKAVHAAEQEVKDLEYWSDIQQIARSGHAPGVADGSHMWPSKQWQGLDPSGPGSNFTSQAKEKGKSPEEIQKDAEVLEDKISARDAGSTDDEGIEVSQEAESPGPGDPGTLSSDEFFSPPEERPSRVDKGKGRAV